MWDPIVSSLKVFSFNFDYNLMFPNNPYETCTFSDFFFCLKRRKHAGYSNGVIIFLKDKSK